jgi:hypothetical protein
LAIRKPTRFQAILGRLRMCACIIVCVLLRLEEQVAVLVPCSRDIETSQANPLQ